MADDDTPNQDPPKVPDNPAPPTGEPETHPAPPAHDDTLRATVEKLQETVDGLVQQVASLTPLPGDETPTNKPWNHRGFS